MLRPATELDFSRIEEVLKSLRLKNEPKHRLPKATSLKVVEQDNAKAASPRRGRLRPRSKTTTRVKAENHVDDYNLFMDPLHLENDEMKRPKSSQNVSSRFLQTFKTKNEELKKQIMLSVLEEAREYQESVLQKIDEANFYADYIGKSLKYAVAPAISLSTRYDVIERRVDRVEEGVVEVKMISLERFVRDHSSLRGLYESKRISRRSSNTLAKYRGAQQDQYTLHDNDDIGLDDNAVRELQPRSSYRSGPAEEHHWSDDRIRNRIENILWSSRHLSKTIEKQMEDIQAKGWNLIV